MDKQEKEGRRDIQKQAPSSGSPVDTVPSHSDSEDDDVAAYDFSEMTTLQMMFRQLSLFRLRKNIDPTWKAKAIQTVPRPILLFYVISSASFAPPGTIVLWNLSSIEVAVSGSTWYPWLYFGIYLWLQSAVTTFSDVIFVDRPSIWHPIDRVFAWFGMIFVTLFYLALLLDDHVRLDFWAGITTTLLCQLLSVVCFAREWIAKARGDIKWTLIYHTGWHFFAPIGFTCLLIALLAKKVP